ncbi:cell wall protein SED1 [Phlyctema vagabunda]|uniref:Cell wall protein SED1 n=1 Tax=Phlyctema vagabunda TaxID=108571 RepID=A0ABR4PAM4_9HELO
MQASIFTLLAVAATAGASYKPDQQPNTDAVQIMSVTSNSPSSNDTAPILHSISTVSNTKIITISSCAPTVLDCPYTTKPITTHTVEVYTTRYSGTGKKDFTSTTGPKSTSSVSATKAQLTTSIVSTMRLVTISACPSTVHDCPYTTKPLTTETVEYYTTVCPVTGIETRKEQATAAPAPQSQGKSTTILVVSSKLLTISACVSSAQGCPLTTKPVTKESYQTLTSVVAVTETDKINAASTVELHPTTSQSSSSASAKHSNATCVDCFTYTAVASAGFSQTTLSSVTQDATPTIPYALFTGAANPNRAGGMLIAVGLAAAML